MEGLITNFRGGRHTKYNYQMIIKIKDVSSKEKVAELVGKEVIWSSPAGKEIKGKISAAHGNSGAMRVIFETGMPGQAISTKIQIK